MSMALKVDVAEACKSAGTEKPIDLVHLSRLTMGDKDLELDVLKMFLAQIPNYIEMMKTAQSSDEIYVAAHTIKGAASNVGAFSLAQMARDAEQNQRFAIQDTLDELSMITEYVSLLAAEA